MMKRITISLALTAALFGAGERAVAQVKDITRQQLLWVRYYGKLVFDDHWSLNTEIEERRYISPARRDQRLLPRVTMTRKLNYGWDAGAGFAYLLQALPQDGDSPVDLVRPEIRPHQELNYRQNPGSKFQLSHRYRMEERFVRKTAGDALADGYTFNFRFRYLFQVSYPIVKHESNGGTLALKAYDELFINIGHHIVRNVFDHNRLAVGLNYGIGKNFQLQADYINWFQERSNGDQFYSRDISRVTLYHNFKLQRKA